jgi:tetratricopeptide (TPR) repeat protein
MADQLPDLIEVALRARSEHRLDEALAALTEAVELSRAASNQPRLAQALVGLGRIERDLKDSEPSLRHYTEAAKIYQQLGDSLSFAHAIRHAADMLRHEHRLQDAKQNYTEALDTYRNHPDTNPLDLANAVRGLALLERETGNLVASKSLWQEARSLYESVGIQAGVDESDAQLGLFNRK